MPKTYPDDAMLEQFVHGKLSRRENLKVAWHLFNSAESRQRVESMVPWGSDLLESLFAGLEPLDTAGSPSYQRAFARGQSALEVGGEVRDRDRSRAPKLFAELMRHPVSRQRALIQRTWRFKNYVFAEYLLEQGREYWNQDPAKAEDLADLALAVAEQLDETYYGSALLNDLRARAWSYIGNARRITSELRSAEEALAQAETHRGEGTQDPLLRASMLRFEGCLKSDQRQFDDAIARMDESIAIYREASEDHWVGVTTIAKAKVLWEADRPLEGVEIARESLELIDSERDERSLMCGEQILASCLFAAGKHKEAKASLGGLRTLTDKVGNELDLLRLRWLEGHIDVGLNKKKSGEKTLSEVRDEFAARGLGYDAALVSLEMATMYAEQGRTAEIKDLAENMVPIFQSRDVHREATAALILFQQAATAEELTLQMAQDISTYLVEARLNPELRFKRAS